MSSPSCFRWGPSPAGIIDARQLFAEDVETVQDPPGMSNKQFTGFGRPQSAVVSNEQELSKRAFERAEPLTARRDGAMCKLCGRRKGTRVGAEYRQSHRNQVETGDVAVHLVCPAMSARSRSTVCQTRRARSRPAQRAQDKRPLIRTPSRPSRRPSTSRGRSGCIHETTRDCQRQAPPSAAPACRRQPRASSTRD